MKIRKYIRQLAASGRYSFSSDEARIALGTSAPAAKLALYRIMQEGDIASPARGFYVIVPPEYRSLGCLPADQFIPALMERADMPYYVGLLSAAQYHGAAHQRPQEFQVMLEKTRRPIHCGQVRVAFYVRKRLPEVQLDNINTARGPLKVSSPEATALDLIGYERHAGGLDQVATVLAELVERIDPQRLVAAAQTAPIPWSQRLGYLIEQTGAAAKAAPLKRFVQDSAQKSVPLLPRAHATEARRNAAWRLLVNSEVEVEM